MKTKLFILFLTLLSVSSCSKDKRINDKEKEEKPPTEVNHFYFYVNKNGEKNLYVAEEYSGVEGHQYGITYYENVGAHHQISQLNGDSHNKFMYTISFLDNITHTGIYQMMHSDLIENGTGGFTYLYQSQAFLSILNGIYISEDNCGTVDITYLSPDKKEFKGDFNMILYNPTNPQDSIVIEDGHFWIDMNTLNQ